MFHVFWQHSLLTPFPLHLSPSGLSKIAHMLPTEYTAIFMDCNQRGWGKKSFASLKHVYWRRQAQAHTGRHTQPPHKAQKPHFSLRTVFVRHGYISTQSLRWTQVFIYAVFSSKTSRHSCLRDRAKQPRLLNVARGYIRHMCSHSLKSYTEGKAKCHDLCFFFFSCENKVEAGLKLYSWPLLHIPLEEDHKTFTTIICNI